MNIESSISNVTTPDHGDDTSVPTYLADFINAPAKMAQTSGKELKRVALAEANTMTTINIYKKGAIVFEEGTPMKNGQGRWVKVYYEDDDKLKWKTQIGCLGEFHSGTVTRLSGPTHFLINGVALNIVDYYKSI